MGKREILVGLMFFGSLAGFFALALVLAADTFQIGRETQEIEILFEDVSGLNAGVPVWLNGQPVGSVKRITRDPDTNRLVVAAEVDADVRVRQNYQIEIRQTLFGAAYISMYDQPDSRAPIVDMGERLIGQSLPDPFAQAAKASEQINNILVKVDGVTVEIQRIAESLTSTEAGIIGRLISDPSFAQDVQAIIETARITLRQVGEGVNKVTDLVQTAQTGEGLLAALLTDQSVAQSVRTMLANAETISDEARLTMADVRAIVANVNEGRGVAGLLIDDEEARDRLRSILDQVDSTMPHLSSTASSLANIMRDLDRGEGTLGPLLKDRALYDQLMSTLATASRALEDLRETTPITTFATLLFQAFQ